MTERDDKIPPAAASVERPTIRDVARVAGVSIGTVSAVINDRDAVSPTTRRHVARCIVELGFEPNSAARGLKRRRVSSIGLIVPDLDNPFFASVAQGVQEAAAEHDVMTMLCLTASLAGREDLYAQVVRSRRLDGVIYLSGSGMPSTSLLQLARDGLLVFVDEKLPGINAPFVSAENRKGARAVARLMLASGHARVAIVGGPPRLWTGEQRLAGFREALAGGGIDPDSVAQHAGDYSEQSGYEIASLLLDTPAAHRPTGVICANDLMAMGVLRRCRDLGLRPPADLSITGFDDIPAARILDPPLTTVTQPGRAMGTVAARLLLRAIGFETETTDTVLPTIVQSRGSIAAP